LLFERMDKDNTNQQNAQVLPSLLVYPS